MNPKSRSDYDAILFGHLTDEIKDFAIFMIDNEERLVTWNPGVERLLGFKEHDFVGRPFSLIFMPEDRDRGLPSAELQRAREAGRAEDDRWHRRADGTTLWASVWLHESVMADPASWVS